MTSKSTAGKLVQLGCNPEIESALHDKRFESIRASNQYFEAFLHNTNMPIFLKDAEFKYIFMNRQLGHLARVDHTQVQGKDDFDVFSEPVARLFREQDEEVIRRKSLIEFEETIALPDGVQSFMTSKFPLFDSEGRVHAVGGVCTDITARKKAEAELKEAEEKYRGIFEHSALGILHIDKKGVITACNEKLAEIIEAPVERIIGVDLLQSLHAEDERAVITSALSGRTAHYESNFKSLTGEVTKFLRGAFSPVSTSNGSVVAAIGIIEDITRRKTAEEALQRAHDGLEQRVVDRTAQLNRKTERLQETNVALKVLLEKREEDRKELEEKVMLNLKKSVYPYIEKLKMICDKDAQNAFLEILQTNLDNITSSFGDNRKNYLSKLTPTQIQVADLIGQGHKTKEIASLLNLSPLTIARHRQEIRKRLCLKNNKTNLQATLIAEAK